MKLRDHIADLISGGALTRAKRISASTVNNWVSAEQELSLLKVKHAPAPETLEGHMKARIASAEKAAADALDETWRLTCIIQEILASCKDQKSGTAKRITRICKEALDD